MNAQTVQVNLPQCELVGLHLRNWALRPEFYQREFLTSSFSKEEHLRMQFFAVAICHQTYSLQFTKAQLYGWDVIEKVAVQMARERHPLLKPEVCASSSIEQLRYMLASVFSEERNPESCQFENLEERARILQQIGKYLMQEFNGSLTQFLESTGFYLIHGGAGLYKKLSLLEGFCDPLRKKSSFFIKLATEANLIDIRDKENLIPIMDYHMQRVLLRMGCVEVLDQQLATHLRQRDPLLSDTPIREACIEALRIIARKSSHGLLQMNDIFWPLGRSCCNEKPLCVHGLCEKSPCTLTTTLELKSHKNCIFIEVCKGTNNPAYRSFWQPVIKTHFY